MLLLSCLINICVISVNKVVIYLSISINKSMFFIQFLNKGTLDYLIRLSSCATRSFLYRTPDCFIRRSKLFTAEFSCLNRILPSEQLSLSLLYKKFYVSYRFNYVNLYGRLNRLRTSYY